MFLEMLNMLPKLQNMCPTMLNMFPIILNLLPNVRKTINMFPNMLPKRLKPGNDTTHLSPKLLFLLAHVMSHWDLSLLAQLCLNSRRLADRLRRQRRRHAEHEVLRRVRPGGPAEAVSHAHLHSTHSMQSNVFQCIPVIPSLFIHSMYYGHSMYNVY